MKLTMAQGVTNAVGTAKDVSWEGFCDLMEKLSVTRSDESDAEKRSALWFSPCAYQGNHRRRENIIGKPWAVVADLDAIYDPKAVEKAIARWEYIAWTTWTSTPAKPRWRVVIPIDDGGCDPDRYGTLVDRVLGPIGEAASVDPRSRMVEQLWFVPWHRRSQAKNHVIWRNSGRWIREGTILKVNFSGVRLANKPESITKGGRNESLVIRLGEPDALRCTSLNELIELALKWNDRLPDPMSQREVRDVARKKWKWLQRGEGLIRRAEAWKGHVDSGDLPDIGVGLMSNEVQTAKLPPSLVGDFLYPGATMISAKMKEGKSYIAMQLAMAAATGTPFLAGSKHAGFPVRKQVKAVILAGEDTDGGIAHRFMGSIAAGHLPTLDKADDVLLVFNDHLDEVRKARPKVPGLALFEGLVARWYDRGYRIVAIDPLRVLEAAFHIHEYPGFAGQMNAHARDFSVMRYYTKVAQAYDDLCIIISMHHGKNKRDHDASDPGDMIAGTTGFGAGAITTISLLPIPDQLGAEEDKDGLVPKRRELYFHGRYTREQRVLIEQGPRTGVWQAIGLVADEMMGEKRRLYFEALDRLGGTKDFISAEAIAKSVGKTSYRAVHAVLNRAAQEGNTYMGWRLMIKRGPSGGYKLVENPNPSAYRKKEK